MTGPAGIKPGRAFLFGYPLMYFLQGTKNDMVLKQPLPIFPIAVLLKLFPAPMQANNCLVIYLFGSSIGTARSCILQPLLIPHPGCFLNKLLR